MADEQKTTTVAMHEESRALLEAVRARLKARMAVEFAPVLDKLREVMSSYTGSSGGEMHVPASYRELCDFFGDLFLNGVSETSGLLPRVSTKTVEQNCPRVFDWLMRAEISRALVDMARVQSKQVDGLPSKMPSHLVVLETKADMAMLRAHAALTQCKLHAEYSPGPVTKALELLPTGLRRGLLGTDMNPKDIRAVVYLMDGKVLREFWATKDTGPMSIDLFQYTLISRTVMRTASELQANKAKK
jgi:hypothetical protein